MIGKSSKRVCRFVRGTSLPHLLAELRQLAEPQPVITSVVDKTHQRNGIILPPNVRTVDGLYKVDIVSRYVSILRHLLCRVLLLVFTTFKPVKAKERAHKPKVGQQFTYYHTDQHLASDSL